uniref:Uncharacterized protein n=1 Tax=Bigelowiella natans TaxID=227086 RepID=A0A6U3I763_BIGNA|mmetsp:Transcript_1513/g.2263  ORF Transcript_1513/g.2263 Transcript_1513/m.2263 type:complete len:460 (+) Transcript_1513:176-1555(+)
MGNTVQKTEKTCAEIFDILDVDSSNSLDIEELKHLVSQATLDFDLEELLKADKNADEVITRKEFRDYFVKHIEAKTLNVQTLERTVRKLKDTKELIKSLDAHNREGNEENRLFNSEKTIDGTDEGAQSPTNDINKESDDKSNDFQYRVDKVKKRSGGVHVGGKMQERTLVLTRRFLHYYKRGTVRPMGEIPLKYVSDVSSEKNTFAVTVGKRIFDFECEDDEDAEEWATAIQTNMKHVARELSSVPKGKFWKVDQLPQVRFDKMTQIDYKKALKEMKTGDLLLFQTKGVAPAIVRSATSSIYDHVGLFVRRGARLGVLESLGEPGVIVSSFGAFYEQGWFQQYTGLVVRRLEPALDANALKQFRRFCRGVEGKKYGLTAGKLMRRMSTMSFDDKDRTYFCSELVAKALKHLNLLRKDCASTEYTPAHFSPCEKLVLTNGFSYGPEMLIKFPPLKKKSKS